MARIETYPLDGNITINDFVLGTDGDSLNATKNYSVQTFLDYLGTQYGIQSSELLYRYDPQPSTSVDTGKASTNNYLSGPPPTFAGVTNWYLSKITAFGQLVEDYINSVSTDQLTFMVMDQADYNNYGIYNITSAVDADANTINVTVTAASTNGTLTTGTPLGFAVQGAGGATGNFVTLDTVQTITAAKTFSANTTFDGFILADGGFEMNAGTASLNVFSIYKRNTVPTGADNGGAAGQFFLNNNDNWSFLSTSTGGKGFVLNNDNITSLRTFTLPNEDGTIALDGNYVDLTTTQAVGGLKTFNSGIHTGNGQIIFNDDLTPSGYASGGAMGYNGNNKYYFYQDHANVNDTYGVFDFVDLTVPRTYTMPDASGTLAIVNDTVYGASWNGDTAGAASRNAIYDRMQLMCTLFSAQTVSGSKTFSGFQYFTGNPTVNGGGLLTLSGSNSILRFENKSTASTNDGTYPILYFNNSTEFSWSKANSASRISHNIDNLTAHRVHTWQDRAGTVAHLDQIGGDAIIKVEGSLSNVDFTSGAVDTTVVAAPGAGIILELVRFSIFYTGWNSTGLGVQAQIRYNTANVGTSLALDIASGSTTNATGYGNGYALQGEEQVDARNDALIIRLTNTTAETTTGTIDYKIYYRVWTP